MRPLTASSGRGSLKWPPSAKGWDGIIRMQGFTRPDALAQIIGFASKGAIEFSEVVRPPEILDLYTGRARHPDFATKKKLTQELMAAWTDKYCLSTFYPLRAPAHREIEEAPRRPLRRRPQPLPLSQGVAE